MEKASNLEVEARVIHKDDHIGLPLHDILLAAAHTGQDGAQMEQHRHEAHIGQLAVVGDALPSLGLHQVATEVAEAGLGVRFCYRFHQLGGMKVARCLACYEVILHRLLVEQVIQLVHQLVGGCIDRHGGNGHVAMVEGPVVRLLILRLAIHIVSC